MTYLLKPTLYPLHLLLESQASIMDLLRFAVALMHVFIILLTPSYVRVARLMDQLWAERAGIVYLVDTCLS
jgi:hypothetical protein